MRWGQGQLIFVSLLVSACATEASIENVALPTDYFVTAAPIRTKDVTCTTLPPYQGSMVFYSKYRKSDPEKSHVIASLDEKYRQDTFGINRFNSHMTKLADRLVKSPTEEDLKCYLDNLTNWSKYSSLATSKDENYVGKAVKKWALASIASNYLKVITNHSTIVDQQQDQDIKKWISILANQVTIDYSNRKASQINNHDYWAAWAVMASAAVLNDTKLYRWAEGRFVYATQQIDDRGFLPNELKRSQRAANYHNYAMQPLAMLGLFINVNNPDTFSAHRPSLELLADNLFIHATGTPIFELETGVKQVDSDITINGRSAWLAAYLTYSPAQEKQIREVIDISTNLRSTRLGGDLGFLFLHPTNHHNKE
ncbi:alginate lyase family protein [Vibrio fluminensis]|uniref:alginate lyase family protein n=1 Tax=Vibrio fluminensis TaxID=2783614 RepID=UPI001888914C|nr:alginate lyase family protein [Vibrio fluminensis]